MPLSFILAFYEKLVFPICFTASPLLIHDPIHSSRIIDALLASAVILLAIYMVIETTILTLLRNFLNGFSSEVGKRAVQEQKNEIALASVASKLRSPFLILSFVRYGRLTDFDEKLQDVDISFTMGRNGVYEEYTSQARSLKFVEEGTPGTMWFSEVTHTNGVIKWGHPLINHPELRELLANDPS